MTPQEFTSEITGTQSHLFALALHLTQQREEAEDLVQETWLAAYRSRDKFTPGTNFKQWIYVIMRYTHINRYRKKRTRQHLHHSMNHVTPSRERRWAVANGAEQTLGLQELSRQLNALGERYCVPFLMFFRGYDYQEIAAHLNLPLGTVKSRLFQARQKMRALVDDRA